MSSASAEVISIFEVGDFESHIARGAAALRSGNLIVLPTETVYGVAGLVTDAGARKKLQALRGSDATRPLTIHLASRDDAAGLIGQVGPMGHRLMKKLWPGPVGLMFDVPADRQTEVARGLGLDRVQIFSSGSIVLRCPDHIVATEVIARAGGPVVITQAPGSTPATKVDSLTKEVNEQVELIYDAGPSRYSRPSTIVKLDGEKYSIVREGVYDERIIQRLLRTTILFVCSGNTCRSPMAEALTRKAIADRLKVPARELEPHGISVLSAGSFAMPGARATPAAVEAVAPMGADLSKHHSRPLSVELIHQADAIFAMGKSHLQAVAALVPSAMEKASTLDPSGEDVDDPIGSDVEVYRLLAVKLQGLIDQRLKEIDLSI